MHISKSALPKLLDIHLLAILYIDEQSSSMTVFCCKQKLANKIITNFTTHSIFTLPGKPEVDLKGKSVSYMYISCFGLSHFFLFFIVSALPFFSAA